ARRPGSEVAGSDQRHGEAPGSRVKGRTGPRHAAADHNNVERVAFEAVPRRLAVARIEARRGAATWYGRCAIPHTWHASAMPSASAVAAIDQGTTSTRCMLFDRDARVLAVAQLEHAQHFPRPGWVEHDPAEIWTNTPSVVNTPRPGAGPGPHDSAARGTPNQREPPFVWDRSPGAPIAPAIVWQDTRTQAICDELGPPDRYRARVGLPLAT